MDIVELINVIVLHLTVTTAVTSSKKLFDFGNDSLSFFLFLLVLALHFL